MGKRKRVPHELHSELSEYASLLRALNTSNALDLASHLTCPKPSATETQSLEPSPSNTRRKHSTEAPPLPNNGRDDLEPDGSRGSYEPPAEFPGVTEGTQKGKEKAKENEIWTRWPLLPDDVYAPQWSLSDEVRVIASKALRAHGMEDDEELLGSKEVELLTEQAERYLEGLYPPYITGNLLHSDFLSDLLSSIASYMLPTPESLQHRTGPRGWRDIVDVVRANDLIPGGAQANGDNGSEQLRFRPLPEIPFLPDVHHYVLRRTMDAIYGILTDTFGEESRPPLDETPLKGQGPTALNAAFGDVIDMDEDHTSETFERYRDIAVKFQPSKYTSSKTLGAA
ncbi:hypothetical protein PUNSTDRAFT_130108 [Punctularia strigosozonata HHB-11173 SS5]|uniref:uncharacterized protein n=1 Tax=Punctularia strigosozonata (strain HHB-11173) TaxID=741275 RepID=UPI0004416348|nr:uncharacterized protein PUNSTDRAFT_130108 [Punctularia strigosozonata HHB-11173 SS5]EIN14481.1 hypothetical protein PUNSTDRAFT_130108 [Punctularia strigosozonata HHB-11173 SS5]